MKGHLARSAGYVSMTTFRRPVGSRTHGAGGADEIAEEIGSGRPDVSEPQVSATPAGIAQVSAAWERGRRRTAHSRGSLSEIDGLHKAWTSRISARRMPEVAVNE